LRCPRYRRSGEPSRPSPSPNSGVEDGNDRRTTRRAAPSINEVIGELLLLVAVDATRRDATRDVCSPITERFSTTFTP
jgi:hypothetical protein